VTDVIVVGRPLRAISTSRASDIDKLVGTLMRAVARL
jgi:hypothetical protein